jgi:hypothetical protein
VVVLTAFFIGLNAVNGLLPSVVPPGLALFSLLGLLVVLDGLSRIVLPARYWYWRFPTAVLVVAFLALANRSVDKLQFENMAYDPWSRTDLRERVAREYLPGPRTGVGAERDGLVDDREARQAWRGQAPATGARKPKLVVVCCSGGGARSLVWTATVLDRLGQAVPGFDDSVRVIAAGSAGGTGAGYYVKARYDRLSQSRTPRVPAGLRLVSPGWSETVPRDSESAVIRSIALAEIWRMFDPRPVRGAPPNDRGRELERQWEQLSQLPLEELRAAERAGLVPSLILAPTTLEDGRRLFISNLDLLNLAPILAVQQVRPLAPRPLSRGLVLCGGSELLFSREAWSAVQGTPALVDFVDDLESGRDLYTRKVDASGPAGAPRPPAGRRNPVRPSDVAQTNYSLTGVEFARAFDRANGFRLATAARMSATAPMISPAVYLPSDPELRVADSGFYDNYGVDVAAAWLFRNRCWLKANTSGVLLVQIRAMGRREMRTGVVPPAAGFFPQFFKGFRLVGSVAEGAERSFSTGAIFRNDRLVAWLAELFNGRDHADPFFTTVVFENTAVVRADLDRPYDLESAADLDARDASYGALTWRLTQAEARSVRASFPVCELRLMPLVNDLCGIPAKGKDLVVVAAVDGVLHIRVFDADGKVAVDTDEKRLTDQARNTADLRKELETLGPPHELTIGEKGRVISAVTSIVGYTPMPPLITGSGPAIVLPESFCRERTPAPGEPPAVTPVARAVDLLERRLERPSPEQGTDREDVRAAMNWELEKEYNRERLLSMICWWQKDHVPVEDGTCQEPGP